MIIVLDTNVFRADFLMRSATFDILLDYVARTDSRIIVPQIVFDELMANYERELILRISHLEKARKSLGQMISGEYESSNPVSIIAEKSKYRAYFLQRLSIDDSYIYPLKDSYLQDVVNRAINRRRPCNDKGEEMRDALLWLSVLDIASEPLFQEVSFVSANTRQFSGENKEVLHQDLLTDIQNRDVTVNYYDSLSTFVDKWVKPVQFVDRDWILSHLDSKAILDAATQVIEYDARWSLDSYLRYELPPEREDAEPTGYFNRITDEIDLETFRVYELTDSSFRILAVFRGEIEIECEYEYYYEQEEEFDWEYDYDEGARFRIGRRRHKRKIGSDTTCVYPEVEISVDITVRDGNIESWTIQG